MRQNYTLYTIVLDSKFKNWGKGSDNDKEVH